MSNQNAEQGLLGCLLVKPDLIGEASAVVAQEDFIDQFNGRLFEALIKSDADSDYVDAITMGERMPDPAPDGGWIAYCGYLVHHTVSTANTMGYAKAMADSSLKRRAAELGRKLITLSENNALTEEELHRVQQEFMSLGSFREGGPKHLRELLPEWVDRLDARMERDGTIVGAGTGLADFDRQTQGLEPGNLVIVAGRPSMGKTALAIDIARHRITSGDSILLFSLEMPSDQIITRLTSQIAKVAMHKIRSGVMTDDELESVIEATAKIAMQPLIIDDSGGLNINDLRSRARRAKLRDDVTMVIVDYLQLMQADGRRNGSRESEVSDISRGLKQMAKDLDVPVVALSQLNRGLEQRENKRPRMSDLRESGAIEQDADIIAFVYRHAVYDEEFNYPAVAELIISKQRNGPIGTTYLHWADEIASFRNCDTVVVPEYRRALATRKKRGMSADDL